jgi:hypothetical protein
MRNIICKVIAAAAAVSGLALASPAQAGLVMTISDSLGNTVTVNGTQPGGPGPTWWRLIAVRSVRYR